MNTQTYVGIVISLILVVLLILYLTGVFSSGRRGFSSGEAADLSTKYPVLAKHTYEYPSGTAWALCTNPPKTLKIEIDDNTYTKENANKLNLSDWHLKWAENTWPPGKYNIVDADGYTYWKHETKDNIIFLDDQNYLHYRSSGDPENANPASDKYGYGFDSVFPNNNPDYVYETVADQQDSDDGLHYKFKIIPC